jgi:metal-responsive CopG/Arc/MetJ family transcriptional regulator
MKSHISATIEKDLIQAADRFGQQERRSRSQILEMALEQFLRQHAPIDDEIVTSPGHFVGTFSREETYER